MSCKRHAMMPKIKKPVRAMKQAHPVTSVPVSANARDALSMDYGLNHGLRLLERGVGRSFSVSSVLSASSSITRSRLRTSAN